MRRFVDAIHHVSGRYSRVDRTRLVIRWKEPTTQKRVVTSLAPHGLVPESAKIGTRCVNHTPVHTWVRSEKPFVDRGRFDALMKDVGGNIEWIGPVYFLGDSTDPADAFGVAPNRLALLAPIRRDPALLAGVNKVLDKAGMKLGELEIVKMPDGIPGGDILEILKELEEFKPLLMHCTDAIPLLSPHAASEEPAATYWQSKTAVPAS